MGEGADVTALERFIVESFADVRVDAGDLGRFFFVEPEEYLPFATIMVKDFEGDRGSNLDRPGVFRLNIGVSKATQARLCPGEPEDPTALDRLMRHPVYGSMGWVCVLVPGAATQERARALLREAYELAVARHRRRG
jgi:hypothetical protein